MEKTIRKVTIERGTRLKPNITFGLRLRHLAEFEVAVLVRILRHDQLAFEKEIESILSLDSILRISHADIEQPNSPAVLSQALDVLFNQAQITIADGVDDEGRRQLEIYFSFRGETSLVQLPSRALVKYAELV